MANPRIRHPTKDHTSPGPHDAKTPHPPSAPAELPPASSGAFGGRRHQVVVGPPLAVLPDEGEQHVLRHRVLDGVTHGWRWGEGEGRLDNTAVVGGNDRAG